MQLSPIYLKRLEEATQEGIERGFKRGIEQERKVTIESLMLLRFGTIDPQLQAIIPELIQLKASEFTPLILQLSKEELLTRFS